MSFCHVVKLETCQGSITNVKFALENDDLSYGIIIEN